MNVNTIEPVRTAPPVYQGGCIHECDPAAVERLRAIMAEQRRAKEEAEAARLARQNDDAARLLAAAKRRKAQRQEVEPKPAPAPDTPRPPRARKQQVARTRFSAEQLAGAMKAHADGRVWSAIAAELGTNRTALREALIAAGYDPYGQPPVNKGFPPRISDDEARAIHARQLAGESLTALAAEYGVACQMLNRRFRRLGLPSAQTLGKTGKYTQAQVDAAIAARESGKLWREIAAEMGVNRTALRDALRRRGFRAHANGHGATE